MFCLVQWVGEWGAWDSKQHRKRIENARMDARKGPQKARKEARQRSETQTIAQDSSKEPLEASPGPPAREVRPPRRAQESPRRPRTRPKTAPKGPEMGSKRPSEGWTEQVWTKKLKLASRLSGSTIFEGRTTPKRAPNRPDLAPKSAQKASRTEDSTGRAEHSADRPEIRPRTADGRLEGGSEPKTTQVKAEVKIYPSGQTCVRSSLLTFLLSPT